MIFTDDELRLILSVMNQANYPPAMFAAAGGVLTKLQIALSPDLQPMTPPAPSDGQGPSRPERRRAAAKAESPPPAE